MPNNETITRHPALPVLINCKPGEKEDGLATWVGSETQRVKVRVYTKGDKDTHRRIGSGRSGKLLSLIAAMQKGDQSRVAQCQIELCEMIGKQNRSLDLRDPKYEALRTDWQHFMAGVKLDPSYRYTPVDIAKKMAFFLGTGAVKAFFGLEPPVYSPRPWKKGKREKELRREYTRDFKRQVRNYERHLAEILAGERLAPALEDAINVSHWRITKLLGEAKLVCWHQPTKGRFQTALYCGNNLEAAFWADFFTKNFSSVSVKEFESLCPVCFNPVEGQKKFCTPAHRYVFNQRKYRAKRHQANALGDPRIQDH